MAGKKPVLPIEATYFKVIVGNLFEVPDRKIRLVVNELQRSRFEFSIVKIHKILQTDISSARSVRRAILEIASVLNRQNQTQVRKDLLALQRNRRKTDTVVTSLLKLREPTTSAARTLLDIDNYTAGAPHIETLNTEVHHALNRAKDGMMFPLVQVTLVTHGEQQSREFTVTFDANDYEYFVTALADTLRVVRTESRIVKKAMRKRFTSLIGFE